MDRIFNADNAFFRGLTKIIDSVVVSFCWAVLNIPVILIVVACIQVNEYWLLPTIILFSFLSGPSCSALYYVSLKNLRRSRGYAWSEFWHGFKDSFKQATAACFIVFVLAMIFIADTYAIYMMKYDGAFGPLCFVFAVLGLLLIMWAAMMFAYIARFEIDFKSVVKNSLLMMIASLPFAFIVALIFLVVVVGTFIVVPLIFILPALYMLLKTLLVERTFRKYMSEDDLAAEVAQDMEEKRK